MSFKFNMQKVLDYREQLEEEAKVRLAKAEHDLLEGRKWLDKISGELALAREKNDGKVMQSAERWLYDQYIKGLLADLEQARMRERMLAQIVVEARNLLAARAVDRKLLDKLKEKQRIKYNRAELKQEQNFNDEIATIRHKASAV